MFLLIGVIAFESASQILQVINLKSNSDPTGGPSRGVASDPAEFDTGQSSHAAVSLPAKSGMPGFGLRVAGALSECIDMLS